MNFKKLTIVTISVLLTIALATSCSPKQLTTSSDNSQGASSSVPQSSSQPEEPSKPMGYYPDGETKTELETIVTIGDTTFNFEAFRYVYLNLANQMLSEGEVDEEKLKQDTISYLSETAALLDVVKDNNISLTEDDKKMLDQYFEDLKTQFPDNGLEDALNDMFYTLDGFKQDQEHALLFDKAVAALYKEDIQKNVEENYVHVKHILIQFADDATDAQKAETKTKADGIYKQIVDGASFDDLIKEHGEDPGQAEAGYYFTYNKMVKPFEEKSFAMAIDEVSEPVLSDFGYHIIKKLEFEQAEIDSNAAAYVNEEIAGKLQALLKTYSDKYEIKYCDEWASFTHTNIF